jgi:hypothetical protein
MGKSEAEQARERWCFSCVLHNKKPPIMSGFLLFCEPDF